MSRISSLEEAGLAVSARALPDAALEWMIFEAEVGEDVQVVLGDGEHDRFEWVSLAEALRRCLPAKVAEAFQRVVERLDT